MSIGDALLTAMGDTRGARAADRLCQTCVTLFGADGAVISLVGDGVNLATLGASDPKARLYDELQFTLGEGPCLDAVAHDSPVVIDDLADPAHQTLWPAYREAMLAHRIRGIYALPIGVAGDYVGALEVFHKRPPVWTVDQIIGLADAAELAQIPVLDILGGGLGAASGTPGTNAWTELSALVRTEVSQATGVLMAQLDLPAATALARLRAHAYVTGRSATAVARDVIDHRLQLEAN